MLSGCPKGGVDYCLHDDLLSNVRVESFAFIVLLTFIISCHFAVFLTVYWTELARLEHNFSS